MLGKIEQETKLKALQNFSEELQNFQQRINDNFFRLVVIGEFSSGKSTFINALLGRDILSHATKETTAVLTRIVNVSENDPRKGSAVAFMKNGESLSIGNLDELKEYTTAVSTKYQVAREIEGVEIYMPIMHVTRPLMIMDTPGLNGIAEGHLEQTREIVKKAHACIYLIQQRGLTKDDLEFLKENLVPYQRRFIFVQNFIDEFNSVEEESLDDRINSLQKTLTEQVFEDSNSHEFFICGVSALKELASRDVKINRLYATDNEDLTGADRIQLAQESNFKDFRAILEKNFSEKSLDEIQYRDTAIAILNWTKNLAQRISNQLDEDVEIYQTSREKNAVERIERLIQRIKDRRQDNIMAIRGFVSGEIRKLNREIDTMLENEVREIEQQLMQEINSCSTIDAIEDEGKSLTQRISQEWNRLGSDMIEYCKISFQGMYQSVMERVEEYSGIRSANSSDVFEMSALPAEQNQFQSDVVIEQIQSQRMKKQSELRSERDALQSTQSDIRDQKSKIQTFDDEIQSVQQNISNKRNQISRMGSRPSARIWYENVAVKRGGFFGSIADFFSTKYEQRERRDDSAGIKWDDNRRKLQQEQNRLAQNLNDATRRREAAESMLRRYKDSEQDSEAKIRRIENELNRLRENERLERDKLEQQKTLARAQYISTCKNRLREEVSKYFHDNDGAVQNLSAELKKRTEEGEQKISSDATKEFESSIETKLKELEQARQGNVSILQKKIEGLEQSKNNLASYIEEMEAKLS